jgi:hypothetical protein
MYKRRFIALAKEQTHSSAFCTVPSLLCLKDTLFKSLQKF